MTALLRPPAPAWDDGIREDSVAAASHLSAFSTTSGHQGSSTFDVRSSKRARGSGKCIAVYRGFSLAREPLVAGRHALRPQPANNGVQNGLCSSGHTVHISTALIRALSAPATKSTFIAACNAAAYHTLYRSMESMQELQQSSTRDSETMDLGRESISYREEHLAEGGSARTKTIQTKGFFNFMDLPAEIRVHVCLTKYLTAFISFLAL